MKDTVVEMGRSIPKRLAVYPASEAGWREAAGLVIAVGIPHVDLLY